MLTQQKIAARAAPTVAVPYIAQEGKNDERAYPKTTPREQLVLFAINCREMYGLEIIRAITESSDGEERITVGTLYPVLHGLEQKQLVVSRWGDEDDTPAARNGARRRYYCLSETGRAVVSRILHVQQRLLNWCESS